MTNYKKYSKDDYYKVIQLKKGKKLSEYYLIKKLSSHKIAKIFDCSQYAIWLRLKKFNIPLRSSGRKKLGGIDT